MSFPKQEENEKKKKEAKCICDFMCNTTSDLTKMDLSKFGASSPPPFNIIHDTYATYTAYTDTLFFFFYR